MHKRKVIPRRWKIWYFILPSLLGMMAFYFIPALISLYHGTTGFGGRFVGLANFLDTLRNSAFQLAVANSVRFIGFSVPLNMLIAFMLASMMQRLYNTKKIVIAFMLPLVIPSGASIFFWRNIFADNGFINRILFLRGMETTAWLATSWAFVVILIVFLMRNIGFNLVLFMAGYQLIPRHYYDVAKVEGAKTFQTFRYVTWIYMIPTTFLVFMMSIINSFRIFREIYLLFGPYPHQSVYMLQHFMNNQFVAANMQRLSTTATLLALAIVVLVWGIFQGQRKLSDAFDQGGT